MMKIEFLTYDSCPRCDSDSITIIKRGMGSDEENYVAYYEWIECKCDDCSQTFTQQIVISSDGDESHTLH